MRNFNRLLAGMGVVTAAAFSASTAGAAPAEVVRTGFIGEYLTSCTNESVYVEGSFKEVLHTAADGSLFGHVSIQATGVGDEGNTYLVRDNAWTKFNADGSASVQDQFRMISKGPARNLLASVKLTIFANGDFELTTDRTACAG